ncbi:MAG: riboflavin synthase [Sphingobacteriales bacterium]|nr:MAG: riboflavin synthase [Sphingobacteriales bacterium]
MFTGIIESTGTISKVEKNLTNIDFWIDSDITGELKVDQSVSHNGVCLTVVQIEGRQYKVTAVAETLAKTALNKWITGEVVNLERSLRVGDRLDGHFVQGHVDTVGICTEKLTLDGSWIFRFRFSAQFAPLIVEKGSICIHYAPTECAFGQDFLDHDDAAHHGHQEIHGMLGA